MKAREKNSNSEWKDIAYVQLRNSYALLSEDLIEFQHDNLSTKLNQVDEEKHWQDVRERTAIAAMQGMLANPDLVNEPTIKIEKVSVAYADALVKQLKGDG